MDKFTKIILTLSLSLIAPIASADIGAGIILGQPTGLSVRVEASESTSFDAALAWRVGDSAYLFGHADHLWFKKNAFGKTPRLDFYYGVGAIVAMPDSDFAAALRLPAGLSYKFRDPSLEVFGEAAIAFTVVPETDFEIVGGVGLRYWW